MRSKRIVLHDEEKLNLVNPESLRILGRYKIDMSMRNLSPNTQTHYVLDIQQWLIYILDHQRNLSVLELTDEDITEFLYFCKTEGNNAERIRARIATISAFYRFMRKKRLILENPVEFIDRPKKGEKVNVQTYLTPEQVALMREKLISEGDLQLRTYAMLSLSTMARVSAIASIKWNQVDFQDKVIYGVLEKEHKVVDLFFSDEVKCLLKQLKQQREDKEVNDYGYVFYSGRKRDKPINTSTLNAWCKRLGKAINIPDLHPHDFRHSGATLLKNAGMALEDVSTLLSHESTDTTKRFYIKDDKNRISSVKNHYNI